MNKLGYYVARSISILTHPLFIVSYGFFLIYVVNPHLFALQEERDFFLIFFYVITISFLFPALTIFMLYVLGMLENLEMPQRKQRIIPLIITGTFYCWLFINMLNNRVVPEAFTSFVLGATIALFVCFLINLFNKVSLHTSAIGGLMMGVFIAYYHFGYDYVQLPSMFGVSLNIHGVFLIAFLIIAMGLVGFARLRENAHTYEQLFGGYMIGVLSQVIAMKFIIG